jgi:acyl carrier protein
MDADDERFRQIEQVLRGWLAESGNAGELDSGQDDDTIDSLEGVELVLRAEMEWGIEIPDSELGRVCGSISRLAAALESRQRAVEREGTSPNARG